MQHLFLKEWLEMVRITIIEFCCDPDSTIGQVCDQKDDVKSIKLTRQCADLSTHKGYEKAMELIKQHPGADLWGRSRAPR